MGKVMANELGEYGITVNTIQPGWMATLGEKRQTGHSDDYSAEEQPIPAKRVGTPQDIGASAAFLCSDEAFCAWHPTLTCLCIHLLAAAIRRERPSVFFGHLAACPSIVLYYAAD